MRVLMITTDHLMIDRRILQEARTLRAAGYDVELLAGFECPEASTLEQDGIRIFRFKYDESQTPLQRVMTSLRVHWRLRRLLGRVMRVAHRTFAAVSPLTAFEHYVLGHVLERDYDILHCHDFPLLAVAVEAKRRRGRPLIYDAHELYHAQVQLPARIQRRYRARERRLIGHADLAITVNPFLASIMADDYGCKPLAVILNAAPLRQGSERRSDLRAQLGLAAQDRIVLYQGWMSPERGLDRLIRVARYFPLHVHLVMIGYGPNESELRAISAEQGTDDRRVIFLGPVEADDLARMTPSADLGVIPYHGIDLNNRYCSPNKLFEFLAAGVPFVCNDLPYLRTVIDTYGCGIVADLAKPEAAARAMLAQLGVAEDLSGLKHAAHAAARVLNWEIEGQKLVALYRQFAPGQTTNH